MIPTTFKEFNIKCKNESKCLGDLLFIHGFCVDHSYFTAAEELSKYFNVYMIDLPGHGINTEGVNRGDLKMWKLADYIVSYVEHKKLNNFYLMGHSMGGGLCSLVATKIPQKIKRLFLLCPANLGGLHAGFKAFYIFYPKNMKQKNRLLKCLYAPENYAKFSQNPQWVKMNEQQLQWQLNNWKNMKSLFKEMSLAVLTYLKRSQKLIEVPFTLIVGKYDRTIIAKPTLKFFKKYYQPNQMKDYTFEKSGHLVFEEEPELFIKTILENCI